MIMATSQANGCWTSLKGTAARDLYLPHGGGHAERMTGGLLDGSAGHGLAVARAGLRDDG